MLSFPRDTIDMLLLGGCVREVDEHTLEMLIILVTKIWRQLGFLRVMCRDLRR